MPCFRFTGRGVQNESLYEYYACGNYAYLVYNGVGLSLIVDDVNIGGAGYQYRVGTGQVSIVADSTPVNGYISSGDCSLCSPVNTRYDCLNGKCLEYRVYNTPGLFATLVDCEAACGSTGDNNCQAPNICVPPDYCPPGMVCLPTAEFSQIDGLATALNNSACS